MGMIGHLLWVTHEELKAYLTDSPLVENKIHRDPSMIKHLNYPMMAIVLLLIFVGNTTAPPCLCEKNEQNVYSFLTLKSKKIASVCVEKNHKYIVYRYGLPKKIELTFPAVLDTTSWKKFTYEGYSRGGGAMNAAMNTQALSFMNKEVTYEIYHNSGYADETEESYSHDAGILVIIKGKQFDSKADQSTIFGGLESLGQYEEIENHFGD